MPENVRNAASAALQNASKLSYEIARAEYERNTPASQKPATDTVSAH
jgi:hypothetical protein